MFAYKLNQIVLGGVTLVSGATGGVTLVSGTTGLPDISAIASAVVIYFASVIPEGSFRL